MSHTSLRSLAILYFAGISSAVTVAGGLLFVRVRRPDSFADVARRFGTAAAWTAAIYYVVTVPVMAWLKGAALNYYADRATHLEILWRATHGLGLTSRMSLDYHHGLHWFAAHFTPIVYVFVLPAFQLWPTPAALIVLQTAYLMSAAVPIYLAAKRRIGREAAGWVAASFLLYPTLHYINLYGIEYLELSIPLFAWTLYCLWMEKWPWFAFFLLMTLAVREELGLVVFMLGVHMAWNGRRRSGVAVAALGIVWTAVALKLVIPAFRASGGLVYLKNYASWGDSPGAILTAFALHPISSAAKFMTLPRLGNIAMYLLPLGFLPIASPALMAIAFPNILSTFMSDAVSNYNFTLYYLAPSIPVIYFATIDVLERRPWVLRRADPASLALIIAAATVTCGLFFGAMPVSLQFWSRNIKVGSFYSTSFYRDQYVTSPAAAATARIAAFVPRDADISAEQHLLPLLYDRRRMAVFPVLDGGIDWVMIDRAKKEKTGWAETYLSFREDPERYYAAVEKDARWELVAEDGGARLFRRRGTH